MLVNSLSSPVSPLANRPPAPLKFESLDSAHTVGDNKDENLPDTATGVESDVESEKNSTEINQVEQRELQALKNRDREVRAHELAHASVGGRFVTSGAQFSFQKGSDGRLYAIGGEVGIDTSTVPGDPRATLLKAQVVARAALAPANPSSQDRNVAAQAAVVIQQARVELAAQLAEELTKDVGENIDAFA